MSFPFKFIARPVIGRIIFQATLSFVALQLWATATSVFLLHLDLHNAEFVPSFYAALYDLTHVPSYRPSLILLACCTALTAIHLLIAFALVSLRDTAHLLTHRALHVLHSLATSAILLISLSEHIHADDVTQTTCFRNALIYTAAHAFLYFFPCYFIADAIFARAVRVATQVFHIRLDGEDCDVTNVDDAKCEKQLQCDCQPAPDGDPSPPFEREIATETAEKIVCVDTDASCDSFSTRSK